MNLSTRKITVIALSLFLVIGLPILLLFLSNTISSEHPRVGKEIHFPFLDNADSEIQILFIGFVGCESVCPSSLAKLATIAKIEDIPPFEATFIDIRSNEEWVTANEYAQNFSFAIRGIHADSELRSLLRKNLGVHFSEYYTRLSQIRHSDDFFVLKKTSQNTWIIADILSNNSSIDTINKSLKRQL